MSNTGSTVRPRFIFVDFENVRIQSVSALEDRDRIWLFLGHLTRKLPCELVLSMHSMGSRAKYVDGIPQGKNALDSVLAFVLGMIAEKYNQSDFYIVSKDTGFDPLVGWMNIHGYRVQRVTSLESIFQTNHFSDRCKQNINKKN